MPSPLAHVVVGALVAHASGPSDSSRVPFQRWVAACLFFSMAPDLDALPGILLGDLGGWHNSFSHSVPFAVLFCAATVGLAARWIGVVRKGRVFAVALGCYLGHILMDWMTQGRGVMLAWPLTPERFSSPISLFTGLQWSEGLISVRHLDTLANESVFVLFAVAFYVGIRRVTRRRASAATRHTIH